MISTRTAERYMQSTLLAAQSDTVSHLSTTTIYALTAASIPAETRTAIISRLEDGENLGNQQISILLTEARQEKKRATAEAR